MTEKRETPETHDEALARLTKRRDAAIAARATKRDPAAELVKLELEATNEEKLSDAVAEHGALGEAIARIDLPDGNMVLVKKANHMIMRRFLDKEKRVSSDIAGLTKPNLVYPDWGTFESWVESYPALETKAADVIAYLCGFGRVEQAGK